MFKSYPDAEIDQIISFNFGNNSTHLELVMDSEQDHPTTGWELIPHANPLKVRIIMIHSLFIKTWYGISNVYHKLYFQAAWLLIIIVNVFFTIVYYFNAI